MTTFNYATGDPDDLTAGNSADMNDIKGSFTDLKTFLNGANLDWTNLSPTVDTYYKTLRTGGGQVAPSIGAGTYLMYPGVTAFAAAGIVSLTTPGSGLLAFRLDPADFAVSGRTTKLRVRFQMLVNGTASATSHTAGLYPVATWSGVAGAFVGIQTVGAVVAGSTLLLSSAVASTQLEGNSGDFTMPTAGFYCLAVNSGGTAANSALTWIVELQMRHV